MSEQILKLIDPEILEGMSQLPSELSQGGPIEQSYLSIRALLKRMESAPFESATMTMEERSTNSEGRDIRFIIYKPKDVSQHSGICVYWIHGGGNVLGTPREDDIAALFVDNLKCTMVSVDYKVAPEHKHPKLWKTAMQVWCGLLNMPKSWALIRTKSQFAAKVRAEGWQQELFCSIVSAKG